MRPALLVALVALPLILPQPASAGVNRAKVIAAEQAANEFVRLARNSAKTGKPPRESDPAVKALLDTAFDTSATSTLGVEFSDLPRINQWMAIGDKVGLVYMLAGTGTNNLFQAATNPKTAKLIPQNIAAFETEYGRFTDFQVALWGYCAGCGRGQTRNGARGRTQQSEIQSRPQSDRRQHRANHRGRADHLHDRRHHRRLAARTS